MPAARTCVVAILASLIIALPSPAEVYRWVDDAGIVHLDDDIERVPEAERSAARVFRAKAVSREAVDGPTQGTFARAVARELGLQSSDLQDPVSVLQIVGIYPSTGWHESAALSSWVVEEVAAAARAAARGRRLRHSQAAAETAVLRAATALGITAPPPTVAAEPPPVREETPPIVIAPNIIVEAPAPQVVVRHVRRAPPPLLAGYPVFYSPFGLGIPFAPLPGPVAAGPVPERITPLSNPAGRLHGPLIEPLRARPFTRPEGF